MFPSSFRYLRLHMQFVGSLVFHTILPLELVKHSCTFSLSMRKGGWYAIVKGKPNRS